jgi:hypothetical protein
MKTRLVYLDTETLGLDMLRHDIWEVAWAVEDEPIRSGVVAHSPHAAYQESAMEVNGYPDFGTNWDLAEATEIEGEVYSALIDATVVGANPYFDLTRLSLRWERSTWADAAKGKEPWHYRAIDVESYAMLILNYTRPQGLHKVCMDLREREYDVPLPDHTSAGDVESVRAAFKALQKERTFWMGVQQ